MKLAATAAVLVAAFSASGCEPASRAGFVRLDEDFFYCEIQPNCLTAHGCNDGSGNCHGARSAVRFVATLELPPTCDDGVVVGGVVPDDYRENFDQVQVAAGSADLDRNQFYQRPLQRASHPVMSFDEGSDCAMLIVEWIARSPSTGL